jgi:hypothetical protein
MHIHRPKDNVAEKMPEDTKAREVYYGIRKKVVNKPEQEVYACKQYIDDIVAYSVMTQRNHLYNPFSNMGSKNYSWKPVKKTVFDLYVQFLDTQRETYLNEAEKEYFNG